MLSFILYILACRSMSLSVVSVPGARFSLGVPTAGTNCYGQIDEEGHRGIVPEGVDRMVDGLLQTGRSALVTSATHRRREELGLPPLAELDIEPLRALLTPANRDSEPDQEGDA